MNKHSTEIGQARMSCLQDECAYRSAEEEEEEEMHRRAECLFSTTPLPRPTAYMARRLYAASP